MRAALKRSFQDALPQCGRVPYLAGGWRTEQRLARSKRKKYLLRVGRGAPLKAVVGVAHAIGEQAAAQALQDGVVPA